MMIFFCGGKKQKNRVARCGLVWNQGTDQVFQVSRLIRCSGLSLIHGFIATISICYMH